MKPVWKSKKFWTAIVTATATVLAYIYKDERLATLVMTVGSVLIGGFAVEDHGKARAHVELNGGGPEGGEEEEEEEEEEEDE